MKKILLTLQVLILFAFYSFAQIPSGYYDDASGLTGSELKTALRNVIDGHTDLSYAELWTAFQYTDKKPNGKVWDMYSDVPGGAPAYEYTFITDQCGNYSGEGSCYNREHSMPKSWFNDGYPMYTDMFHLVPSDGYVNGKRSNYPFGEVGSATWTSTNGSKLGSSSYPGYSGTVFEPIDEYKGDFARGYFYMATRYESNISSWNSDMLAGNSFPAFTEWALNLLMDWHEQDPVSQKEIDRNNAIFSYQNNRNPFIDHPEYVDLIWGEGTPSVEFTSSPSTAVEAGNQYTYNVTASGGNGSSITISSTQKPAWLSFAGGANGTATLSGNPSESDEGSHSVVLSATDGESSAEQSFTINVTVTPQPPVFGEIYHSPSNPTADEVVTFSALVTDPDGTVDLVTLHFGNTSNDLDQSLAMSLYSQDVYTVSSIMPLDLGDVYYSIEATDDEGNSTTSTEFQIIAALNQYTLTIDVVGEGTVNVNGSLYSEPLTVDDGTVMSLLAIPNEGSQFDGWSTDLTSTLSEEILTMTKDKSITATFSLINSVTQNGFYGLQIYPNPFSTSIIFINAEDVSKVSFINLMGQTIKSLENPNDEVETVDLPVGLYLLKVEDINGNFVFRKIIKK